MNGQQETEASSSWLWFPLLCQCHLLPLHSTEPAVVMVCSLVRAGNGSALPSPGIGVRPTLHTGLAELPGEGWKPEPPQRLLQGPYPELGTGSALQPNGSTESPRAGPRGLSFKHQHTQARDVLLQTKGCLL